MFKKKIKVCVHDGNFHADDIFAVATLYMVYKGGIKIIRSRDEKDWDRCDFVVDVGHVYDPEINRYDHHQVEGAGVRENGVPYASFGLIWKHFGDKLVSSSEIKEDIDKSFVQQIDASDVGLVDFRVEEYDWNMWTVNKLFKLFNSKGDEPRSISGTRFKPLVLVAVKIIDRLIMSKEQQHKDWIKAEEAYNNAEDKRIIILEKGMAWAHVLVEKPEPIYVIFPVDDEAEYMIQAVSEKEDSFVSRKLLPESWRGKADEVLQEVSGIEDAIFCHRTGHLMKTKTLEGAIETVRKALE